MAVDDDVLTVTVPGDADAVRDIGQLGQLYVRPVIHAIPATSAPQPPTPPTTPNVSDLPQRIADEKELRQGTDQQIQLLALQFQATRCGDDDVLAGNDDPDLPLITCSSDGTTVYLLGKSILNAAALESASAAPDKYRGEHRVELSFDEAGKQVLADYTPGNDGELAAVTVDTSVVSEPQIQEVIRDGQATITGQFTEEQARGLASTLASGPLPVELTAESSDTETVVVERGWTALRIGLLVGGLILAVAVIAVVAYLISTTRQRQPRL